MPTRRDAIRAIAATLGSAGLAAARPLEVEPEERAAMARVAERFMGRYGVPGLGVAIARRGRLVYEEGFGWAVRERRVRATPRSLFRIASVTKPITSVAIFTLVERGRLRLGDRVFGPGAVLGSEFGGGPYKRYVTDITIEHLLTHTCGGWPNDGSDPMFRNPGMSHAQLIAWTIDTLPLAHPPGTTYAYSNFGYCLLGRVIERAAGQPYAAFVRAAVLGRCGVSDMRIAGNTRAQRASAEVEYYGQDGENPYDMNVARMDAHGGWLATAADLVQFAVHVDGFDETPDILGADAIRTMTTATQANGGYAKGWAVNSSHNWWHNGSLPGSATIMVRTQSGLCWAVLANSRKPNSDIDGALDAMMWDMVRAVPAWQA